MLPGETIARMRTFRSLFAGALGVLSLSAQLVALGVGCVDLESVSPVPTTTTSASSGGQGGSPDTSSTTAMGGTTATAVGGSTTAMGGGGTSTGGASNGGNSTGGGGGTGGAIAQMVPDFSLVDLNSMSPSAGQEVSPRDHLSRVSAWYFGHST